MSDSINLEGLPIAIIVVLVCFVVAAGLWYLAIRFRLLQLKIMAVAIFVTPLLGFGFQIAGRTLGWFDPPDYETTTPGPARREDSVIREFPFPVPNPRFPHQIQLTLRDDTGQIPAAPISMHFTIRTPQGELLVEKQATLAPSDDTHWLPLLADFQPVEAGEYLLHLDIPKGVEQVEVRVHEVRRR